MKFVVTGGAGFVGNNIVRILVKNGHDVIVLDNLHTGKKENLEGVLEKIEFHSIDIRNLEELEEKIKDVDGIFHQAALTDVQESFSKPNEYHDVNVIGTKNIFEIAKKYKIKVVFASSSAIYGDSKKIPISEENGKKPISPYGVTKLENETDAERYHKEGLNVIGLRYFNIYGKGQNLGYAGVITKFKEKINQNEKIEIFGNGENSRDFIHVDDVAKINLIVMNSEEKYGFFNIGTGIETSINNLAKTMIDVSGKEIDLFHSEPLEGDIEKSVANIQKTKKIFNWEYEIDLIHGIKKLQER